MSAKYKEVLIYEYRSNVRAFAEDLMDAINLAKSNQHPSVDTVDMLETIFKDDVLDGLFERIWLG